MTIHDVTLAGMTVMASESMRSSLFMRLKWRLVGSERAKLAVRIGLRNCEGMQISTPYGLEGAVNRVRYDIREGFRAKYGMAWWIPILIEIAIKAIEWWIRHRADKTVANELLIALAEME